MQTSFIDGRRNDALTNNFYPDLVTIQTQTESIDGYGAVVYAWANLADHVNLPCSLALTTGDEIKEVDNEYGTTTHRIALNGIYADITRLNRAVINSVNYDIVYASPPGHDNSVTYLMCNITEVGV